MGAYIVEMETVMKFFKKINAMILCLILVLSTVSMTASATDGYANVPAMPETADRFDIYEGVKFEGVLGSAAKTGQAHFPGYNTSNPAQVSFTNPGLAEYACFEFDYYVDNVATLDTRAIKLYFNVRRTASASKGTFEFQNQITQSGWNHVILTTNLSSETLNSLSIVRFYIDMNAGEIGASDRYRVANICATKAAESDDTLPYNPIVNVGKDQTEVYVTWFSYDNKPGKLVFNETVITPFDSGATADGGLYYFRAKATGLRENTTYTYRVGNDDFLSDPFTLKTNGFDHEFSFVHVSDVQLTTDSQLLANWKNTLLQIHTNLPDTSFILDTGDIADTTKSELYGYYKSPELLTGYITSAIHGNHGSTPDSCFNEHFTVPDTYELYPGYAPNDCDYWFGYNSVLFISLNTNIKDSDYHKDFIRTTIEEQGDEYNWIIVNCHHSLFGASYHRNESDVCSFRENLAPFFSEMGVDMVLSGHDHCYDRSYLMEGTSPRVSSDSFAANTGGRVLYVSNTSASAMKFNGATAGSEDTSAKIVESQYGFVNYEVTDTAITLTYYSSADMSVLDRFTLYKDDADYTVEPDRNLLQDQNLGNVRLGSDGKVTLRFEETYDISSACSVEIACNSSTAITVALVDANGNSIRKHFTGMTAGWNHLSTRISDMTGSADLTDIVALEITGSPGNTFALADLFVGHVYSDDEDATCEVCGYERNLFLDPDRIPSMAESEDLFVIGGGARIQGVLGSSSLTGQAHLPGYSSGNPAEVMFSNPGLAGYDSFEFDYYVEDIDHFDARGIKLYFNVRTNSTSKGTFEFDEQIKKSGWNHVKIAADLDSDKLNSITKARFYMDMDAGETGATDRYKIANICATKEFSEPEKRNTSGTTAADLNAGAGLKTSGWKEGRYNSAGCYQEGLTPVDLSGADYIEFDLFVESKRGILEAIADLDSKNGDAGARWRLMLSSIPGDYRGSNYTSVYYLENFEEYITKDGWNHIAIPVSSFILRGSATLTSIASWGIDYYVATNDTNVAKDQRIAVYNICGTKAYTNVAGDVNNDGTTDILDLIRAKKVSAEIKTEYNPNVATFDASGLLAISRILLGVIG